jgi:hypothetical protein
VNRRHALHHANHAEAARAWRPLVSTSAARSGIRDDNAWGCSHHVPGPPQEEETDRVPDRDGCGAGRGGQPTASYSWLHDRTSIDIDSIMRLVSGSCPEGYQISQLGTEAQFHFLVVTHDVIRCSTPGTLPLTFRGTSDATPSRHDACWQLSGNCAL